MVTSRVGWFFFFAGGHVEGVGFRGRIEVDGICGTVAFT
jgi:hypothetical protein